MRSIAFAFGSLCLFIAALCLFVRDDGLGSAESETLVVYCAAGIAPEVSAVARAYEKRFHQRVRLELGGSGTLLTRLSVKSDADLYIAGDVSYVNRAQTSGIVREILTIAMLRPVLAVAKGNPKRVLSLDDLKRDDIKYTLASPEAAAVGRLFRERTIESGDWGEFKAGAHTFKPTVEDVANDVALGVVDVGVVWAPVGQRREKLDTVVLNSLEGSGHTVAVGVLAETPRSVSALRFARFLSGADTGLPIFERAGYDVLKSDTFVESPTILLFCGAMLRVGIDETIQAFEVREGVRVERVYNGCGILVSQMAAGARPDAYITCDRSFMAKVQNLFGEEHELTSNDIVIAVKKGNPRGIRSLEDLGAEGLKVGLGHPTQSALGALTERLLQAMSGRERIVANKELESATGDLLVSQMRVGHLDAVVVYRSNVVSHSGNLRDLDVIPIRLDGALAYQTYAVGKSAEQPRLVGRLLDAIASKDARQPFEALGFQFVGGSR